MSLKEDGMATTGYQASTKHPAKVCLNANIGREDEQLQMRDRSEDKTKTERQRSYNEQPH